MCFQYFLKERNLAKAGHLDSYVLCTESWACHITTFLSLYKITYICETLTGVHCEVHFFFFLMFHSLVSSIQFSFWTQHPLMIPNVISRLIPRNLNHYLKSGFPLHWHNPFAHSINHHLYVYSKIHVYLSPAPSVSTVSTENTLSLEISLSSSVVLLCKCFIIFSIWVISLLFP